MTRTEYMREWRKNHPENKKYQKEYHKKYYSGKQAKIAKKRARKYYEDNKEYVKARESAYYHKHKILKGRPIGKKNPMWKGDKVGYHGLHKWIAKWKGKPIGCEICKDYNKNKIYYWASKSRQYKRDLSDWLRLCGKCHFAYDKQNKRKRDYHGRYL